MSKTCPVCSSRASCESEFYNTFLFPVFFRTSRKFLHLWYRAVTSASHHLGVWGNVSCSLFQHSWTSQHLRWGRSEYWTEWIIKCEESVTSQKAVSVKSSSVGRSSKHTTLSTLSFLQYCKHCSRWFRLTFCGKTDLIYWRLKDFVYLKTQILYLRTKRRKWGYVLVFQVFDFTCHFWYFHFYMLKGCTWRMLCLYTKWNQLMFMLFYSMLKPWFRPLTPARPSLAHDCFQITSH